MSNLYEWLKVLDKLAEESQLKRENAKEIYLQVESELPLDDEDIELITTVNSLNRLTSVIIYEGVSIEQKLSYKQQLIDIRLKVKSYVNRYKK